MHEQTMEFSVQHDKEAELKKTLTIIYDALKEKGYNPINQIVGYILSEDPTYITTSVSYTHLTLPTILRV